MYSKGLKKYESLQWEIHMHIDIQLLSTVYTNEKWKRICHLHVENMVEKETHERSIKVKKINIYASERI